MFIPAGSINPKWATKPNGGEEHEEGHHRPDEPERCDTEHQPGLLEALRLGHEQCPHHEEHHRNDREERFVRLAAFFDRAAGVSAPGRRAA